MSFIAFGPSWNAVANTARNIAHYFYGRPKADTHLCVPHLPEIVTDLEALLGEDLTVEWCDRGNSWIVTMRWFAQSGRYGFYMIRTIGPRCTPAHWQRIIARMYNKSRGLTCVRA